MGFAARLIPATLFVLVGTAAQTGHAFTLNGSSSLQGWKDHHVRFKVDYTSCPLAREDFDAVVDEAIALWNGLPSSDLVISREGETRRSYDEADKEIKMGTETLDAEILCDPQMSMDMKADATFIPAFTDIRTTPELVLNYAYINLNAEEGSEDNISNLPRTTLAIVIAHEMGHVLGLGHTTSRSAIMYFDSSVRTNLKLSQDDVDGITYLYPRQESGKDGVFGCATIASGLGGQGPRGKSAESGGGPSSPGGSAIPMSAINFFLLLLFCLGCTWIFKRQAFIEVS